MNTSQTYSKTKSIGLWLVSGFALFAMLEPGLFNNDKSLYWLVYGIGTSVILISALIMYNSGYFSKENLKTIEFKAGIMQSIAVLGIMLIAKFDLSKVLTVPLIVIFVCLFIYSCYLIWAKD